MDERMASSARNAREVRKLRALDRIADNLEGINTTLGMWYARTFPDCELPLEISAEENAEGMQKMHLMLDGVHRRQ